MTSEPSNETADSLTQAWFPEGQDPAAYDPVRSARASFARDLPKRFYSAVTVEARAEGFAILLDGRPARTRARGLLALPTAEAAACVAAEWSAQVEVIRPISMPATRIAHAGLDHVAGAMEAVRADILAYAGSDATCYRAADPVALVAMQAQHWDPVLAHIHARYGARFMLSEGIRHVAQPEASIAALAPRLAAIADPVALGALHVLTTISGSALVAIAMADGVLDADAGFAAGEVDSDYEVAVWGADEEAAERRANRLADFRAANALFHAIGR